MGRYDLIRGQIANLSFGGVMITHVDAVSPEGDSLIVRFQVEKEKVELEGRSVSKIVHTIREVMEGGEIISLGVKFEERREEITSKLIPVFRCLMKSANTGNHNG